MRINSAFSHEVGNIKKEGLKKSILEQKCLKPKNSFDTIILTIGWLGL